MGTIYKNSIPYGGGGSSLPDGGTTGQALVKKTNVDQDVEWADVTGASIQVDTMPTASATEEGKIYQYVGATNSTFTNGYFYQCVFDYPDPTGSLEWMWKRIDVQPSGSGLPTGGTTGQYLVKKSDADGDAEWKDLVLPDGWGVAKSGTTSVSITGTTGSFTINISDLGIASVNDYNVVFSIVGGTGAGAWGDSNVFAYGRTTSAINGSVNTVGGDIQSVLVSYVVVAKGFGSVGTGSSLPTGGTTGQILAKVSDGDGDVNWVGDTGKDLNKLVEWGRNTSTSLKLKYVITDYTPGNTRVTIRVPIHGTALQGIEATESSLKSFLKTRFKIQYTTSAFGSDVFNTTASETSNPSQGTFGMNTDVIPSGWDSSRLAIFIDSIEIENNILSFAISAQARKNQGSSDSTPTNVILIANDGYDFGNTVIDEPFYVHNLTKTALDDLHFNNLNAPSTWGIATSGIIQVPIANQVGQFTSNINGLGITNPDDYNVAIEVIGGGTGSWGDSKHYLWEKSTNRFAGSVITVGSDVDRVDISYTVFAKGYGNLVEGGSGGSETLDEVLTNGNEATDKTIALKNSTDNGTTEIDSYGITQSYDDGAGLGNFAQFAGGTLQMSETNTNDDNTAYIGAKHMNMSSVDANGDPLNHFVMEWSDVANVNMSDDLKEAWRNALGGADSGVEIYKTLSSVAAIPADSTTPIVVDISNDHIPATMIDDRFVQFDYYSYFDGLRQTITCAGTIGRFNLPVVNNASGDSSSIEVTLDGQEGGELQQITFKPLSNSQGAFFYRVTFGRYHTGGFSNLDGTIGRWEKIGELDGGGLPASFNVQDLSKYNALSFSVRRASGYGWYNSNVIMSSDFTVGGDKVTVSGAGDVEVYFEKESDTSILRSFVNGNVCDKVRVYGYKETGISDADVQRIAQQIPTPEDTMKVTFTGGTTIQSADKTFSEIKQALDAGKFVYAQRNIYTGYTGGSEVLYRVYRYDSSEIIFINNMMAYYGAASPAPNKDVTEEVVLTSGNVISSRRHNFAPIYFAETIAPNPNTSELAAIMLAGADDTTYNIKKGGLYINKVESGARTWVPISEPAESTVDVTKVHSNRVDVTDSSSEVQLEFNNEIYGVGIRAEDSSGQIMYQQLANTQIVDNKISDAISPFKDGSSYNATEKQVGTYMGNTPLYQITTQTTVTTTTADGTTASKQVTVLPAVEDIVSIEGIINVNGRYETITNVSELNDKVLGCTVAVNVGSATILEIKNNLTRLSDKPLYVTIKYTKTT